MPWVSSIRLAVAVAAGAMFAAPAFAQQPAAPKAPRQIKLAKVLDPLKLSDQEKIKQVSEIGRTWLTTLAPIWLRMSSPIMGKPAAINFCSHFGSLAINTGMQFRNATPASMAH